MASANTLEAQFAPEDLESLAETTTLAKEDLEMIAELCLEREVGMADVLEFGNLEEEFRKINEGEIERFEAFRPAMSLKEARRSNKNITAAQKGWTVVRAISWYKKRLERELKNNQEVVEAATVVLLRDRVKQVV
jgi:hypothetical protein